MSSPAKEAFERRMKNQRELHDLIDKAWRRALVRRMAQAEQMRTVFGETVVDDFEVYIGFATSPGVSNETGDDVKPDHEIEVPDGE